MQKNLIVPVGGLILLIACCAGPLLVAGIGAAVALAVARAQPFVFIALAIIVAFIIASLAFRARANEPANRWTGLKR